MANVIEFVTLAERKNVADYAAYSVSAATDDCPPWIEYDKVMRNDAASAMWRERTSDYQRQRAAGCIAVLCGGAPLRGGGEQTAC